MPLRKILGPACQVLSAACLAIGCAAVRQWAILVGCGILVLAPLLLRKLRPTWLPTAVLAASVCLAGAGLLSGASPLLMISGTTLALAGWDLALFERALSPGPFNQRAALLEKKHIESLALALGAGLLAAVAVRLIRFEVGFGGLVLIVLLAFYCLDTIWRMLNE